MKLMAKRIIMGNWENTGKALEKLRLPNEIHCIFFKLRIFSYYSNLRILHIFVAEQNIFCIKTFHKENEAKLQGL